LLYHGFFRNSLIWLVFLFVSLCFTRNSILYSTDTILVSVCTLVIRYHCVLFASYNHGIPFFSILFLLSACLSAFHRNLSFGVPGLNSCINVMSVSRFRPSTWHSAVSIWLSSVDHLKWSALPLLSSAGTECSVPCAFSPRYTPSTTAEEYQSFSLSHLQRHRSS